MAEDKIENSSMPEIKPDVLNDKEGISQAETQSESAQEIVLNFLVDKNVISRNEVLLITPQRLDEFIVRVSHEFENEGQKIPYGSIEKLRRILGLKPDCGEGGVDEVERHNEIKKIVEEMREYLKKFQEQCPEVLGLILNGSRMTPDKMPSPKSDMDVVAVLKEGTITDPRTKEGERILYKLRAFLDNTPSNSGLSVELNEFYSIDDLFSKLQKPDDKSKLTWGWNPDVVKYIGDKLDGLDELGVQIRILKGLSDPGMIEFKNNEVAKAKESVIRYLGLKKNTNNF